MCVKLDTDCAEEQCTDVGVTASHAKDSASNGGRVMRDTGKSVGGAVVAALFVLLLVTGSSGAEPTELRAKVVWAHAGRVYLASSDPLPIIQGDLLTVYDG